MYDIGDDVFIGAGHVVKIVRKFNVVGLIQSKMNSFRRKNFSFKLKKKHDQHFHLRLK